MVTKVHGNKWRSHYDKKHLLYCLHGFENNNDKKVFSSGDKICWGPKDAGTKIVGGNKEMGIYGGGEQKRTGPYQGRPKEMELRACV